MTGPDGPHPAGVRLDRAVLERLHHGRELTPDERVHRARSALRAAIAAETSGVASAERSEWQQRVVERLEREAGLG